MFSGAAHFLIKELSYHNLELERSRRQEGGIPSGDVWPFIILADDSCVMWNAVDSDKLRWIRIYAFVCKRRSKAVIVVFNTLHAYFFCFLSCPAERAVSLKQVLQHMEACPDLSQYGLCGIRKWNSRGISGEKTRYHNEKEPPDLFSVEQQKYSFNAPPMKNRINTLFN